MSAKANQSEPREWSEGTARGRAARLNVAEQVAALIVDRELTGAEELTVLRIRQLAAAKKQGDLVTLRAAVMELSVSAAHWAAALDVRQQVRPAA